MSNLSGVPLTYIGDPGVTSVPTVVSGGTLAVRNDGSALTVVVAGGTVNTTVSFSGSINTDIGNVKIEDADDNYAVVPDASVAKTGDTNALVVQHIDPTGAPLYQSTQVAIMNAQGTLASEVVAVQSMNNFGTLATAVGQTTGNALATLVHNAQGTLASEVTATKAMNNFGTLATAVAQTTGNSLATLILNAQGTLASEVATVQSMNNFGTLATRAQLQSVLNNQGTQATSAAQVTGNAILSNIYNSFGTGITTTGSNLELTLLNAATGTGTGGNANVTGRTTHTVQVIISSGSAVVSARTSLNGVHWDTAGILSSSDNLTLEGATKFISASYLTGNATVTVLLNSR